ncbi:serine/threonine protein kinase [Roseiconus nitratireducens]|uniref:Serine/threonine protein kinase n=1 Tax=Roseiconus nitratireducens TaxID=2605748 RepID=A0A5M6DI10_9BACT|nr:serine/threonine-protein kinase [Roseiconus nitratireducens]KAA5547093.1 serine/threonine protein kinase [Roseiconus nitratireducens]
MPSNQLSDYELGDVLGVGTVGTIYLAQEKKSGQTVALKKLHPRVCQNTLIRARFRREMTILERLRHPNVVSYLGGGRDDLVLFYAMEVVPGGTVDDLINFGGPLHWTAVVEITRQVCSALQFVHNHGIVHRDLKPSNLFLTRGGEVKLGDFGIARDLAAGDLTASGITVGTHAYMAPEQIVGDHSVSGKVDLYALGCCMFEMLTARKVFTGENYAQLFDQHLKQPPPSVRDYVDCPQELDEIIQQLLAKNAQDRPFNARQVQAVMLKIAQDATPDSEQTDPTSHVFVAGREELVARIRRRMEPKIRQVDTRRLAIIMGAVVAIIVLLVAISSMAQ